MNKYLVGALAVASIAASLTIGAGPANAQAAEVKQKPPMYSYLANWTLPRSQWAAMEKAAGNTEKVTADALAKGTLVGYGSDMTVVHTEDGPTHDEWWSSMSMAGVLAVLDEMYKSGNAVTPVLQAATKHSDGIYVSRYYNWRPGTYTGAYTRVGIYKLKADAPSDAVDLLSKSFIVPMLEKLLADGAIVEYEVDVESIHTESPDMFFIDVIARNAEGLDKLNTALGEAIRSNPLAGQAYLSMVDSSAHHDALMRTSATYK
ncbi:MAG: hypothetical protein JSR15_11820 [Proteobacteria bacterium]|nr:hypothetical protein [Pseudomonadota bacterium]